MPAPISVVIPARNAVQQLPGCLAALFPGVEAGLVREVIVSSVASNDTRTREITEAAGAIWVEGPEGRGPQLRTGAAHARGDWLLFLHADSWLSTDWISAVTHHLDNHPDKAGAFQLAFRSKLRRARIVAALTNWRARTLRLPYGDQGLLISRKLYDTLGGFEPVALMEDVIMIRKIGRGRLVELPAVAATAGEKQARDGWFLRSIRNMWLVLRFRLGADPAVLAKAYYK